MNIATHNGILTVLSPSGVHRTFKIKTQKDDSNFMPGERIIYLLTGSNNETDYTSFGVIKNGKICLWKRFQNSDTYPKYKNMLENPQLMEKWGMKINFEGHCRRCNKLLSTPRSVEIGLGPTCEGRE